MKNKNWASILLVALILFGSVACQPKKQKIIEKQTITVEATPQNPLFSKLISLGSASSTEQTASRAIFKVELNDSAGTGFFVRRDGVFLTNHHVLGSENCLREGCKIKIVADFQTNQMFSEDKVWVTPLFEDKSTDITVWQAWKNFKNKEKYQSPNFLSFAGGDKPMKLGQEISIIGHPLGLLKKVSHGHITKLESVFFQSLDGLVFHGNSGSPVLNSEGQVLGIVHTSFPESVSNSRNGNFPAMTQGSIFHSQLIRRLGLIESDVVPQSFSLGNFEDRVKIAERVKTEGVDKALESLDLLLQAEVNPNSPSDEIANQPEQKTKDDKPNVVENSTSVVYSVFLKSCPKTIEDFQNNVILGEDLSGKLTTNCAFIGSWIDCENPSPYKFCPGAEQKNKIQELLRQGSEQLKPFSKIQSLNVLLWLDGIFEPKKSVKEKSLETIRQFQLANGLETDLGIAVSVLAASKEALAIHLGTNLLQVIRDSAKSPKAGTFNTLVTGYVLLANKEMISFDEATSAVKSLIENPDITFSEYLEIENLLYGLNVEALKK